MLSDDQLLKVLELEKPSSRPYKAVPAITCEHHPQSPFSGLWVADVPAVHLSQHRVDHHYAVLPTAEDAALWAQHTWRQIWNLSADKFIGLTPEHVYHSPDPLDPDTLSAIMETLPTGTTVVYTGPPQPQTSSPGARAVDYPVTDSDRQDWLENMGSVREALDYAGSSFADDDRSASAIQAVITPLPEHHGEPGWVLWTVREGDLQRLYQHPDSQPDVVQGVCPLRFTTADQAREAASHLGWGYVHEHGLDWQQVATLTPKVWQDLPSEKRAAWQLGYQLRTQLSRTTALLDAHHQVMEGPPSPWFISQDLTDLDASWRVWRAVPSTHAVQVEWSADPEYTSVSRDVLTQRHPEAIAWDHPGWPSFTEQPGGPNQAERLPLGILSAHYQPYPETLVLGQATNTQTRESLITGWTHETLRTWVIQSRTAETVQWQSQWMQVHDAAPLRQWHATPQEPDPPDWSADLPPHTLWKPLSAPHSSTPLALRAQQPASAPESFADFARAQRQAAVAQWTADHNSVNVTLITPQHNPIPPALQDTLGPLVDPVLHASVSEQAHSERHSAEPAPPAALTPANATPSLSRSWHRR
jgi:hypothetical protein